MDPKIKKQLSYSFSESELDFALVSIEEMVEDFKAGLVETNSDKPIWLLESFKYWIKIENSFDRSLQIKISKILDVLNSIGK